MAAQATVARMDAADIYAESRARILELAAEAPAEHFDRPVPATPAWSGRDLLAHLAGVPTDVLEGRLEGAGGNEWTAAQVELRKGRSVDELAEEWRATANQFDAMAKAAPEGLVGALASDVLQHELDLRGALERPAGESALSGLDFGLNFMAGYLDTRVGKAGLPALHVEAGNQEWTLGPGEAAARLTTTPIEFFRVLAGRRSEAQVRALDWQGDPGPYLGVLSAFGPLAPADVTESL
ncbi:MAG: hypothetical protein QOK43_1864 [Acidimicrobiaceae bacterium]|nr:hypothetical protein [Acidimicrobiaceae bacterium]